MNEYSDMNFVLGAIGFICVLFAISKIGSGSSLPTKPKAPEPLSNPGREMMEMPDANFDSNAFQNARQIVQQIERTNDPQVKTMLLADALHRMETYRNRTAERMTAQQTKEADQMDKFFRLAEMLSGRQQTPPPAPQYNPGYGRGYHDDRQRINNYHQRPELPDHDGMQTRPGQWWY